MREIYNHDGRQVPAPNHTLAPEGEGSFVAETRDWLLGHFLEHWGSPGRDKSLDSSG